MSTTTQSETESVVSLQDRTIIRELAKKVCELSARRSEAAKIEEWKRHNRFESGKPMVLVYMEDVWDELVSDESLICELSDAREIERRLRQRLYLAAHILDDRPVTGSWEVPLKNHDPKYGIGQDIQSASSEHGRAGAVYRQMIADDDVPEEIIIPRELIVDREGTRVEFERLSELFGDILDVRQVGVRGFCFTPSDCLATRRGMEQFFIDLVERPEWIHKLLKRMSDSDLHCARRAEVEGLIDLNNGTKGYDLEPESITDRLPSSEFDGERVHLRDMWAVAAAQTFSEVSPAMHEEFATQYEAPCMELFGANSYGCCEPLHNKMDLVRKLPRVKRVSMSPWVDWVAGAEAVGGDMIYSGKPTPSLVQGMKWDAEICRKELVTILDAARANGCQLELILNGTLTCRGEPERYDEWTDMVQHLTQEYA